MELLKHPHVFPVAIMCLYALTSARYAIAGDWGRVMYWVCAAGITFSATFMVGK
jgi:hypothetical protein